MTGGPDHAARGTQTAAEVIAAQRDILLAMYRSHVGPGDDYALLDFPDHANVGDSAIWAGEIALLREVTGKDPAYVCTTLNYREDDLRRQCPSGVVFIHGGGNLGDIWPQHQRFREAVIAQLTDRTVIQLPQSIKFRDAANIAAFAAVVAAHPAFKLYVRDVPSRDFALTKLGCAAELVPDSAFGLGLQRARRSKTAVFVLARQDHEAQALDWSPLTQMPGVVLDDWLRDDRAFRLIGRVRRKLQAMFGTSRAALYNWLATARVERGLAMLASGDMVVTDRLHGHILSTLLDRPQITLDNDYGKIAGYAASWTHGYRGLHRAATPAEAAALIASLAAANAG
jgi:exopolysaccharide biosynthesis predicted pyruvyltransferase EpsI